MASALDPNKLAGYRKLLTDPGKRSTIPNAYLQRLNPGLFQKRQTNARIKQENATTYNPMAMLSGDSLRRTAALLTNQEFDPQIKSAQEERKLIIANDAKLAERISGYYSQANSALATAHEVAQGAQGKLTESLAANRQFLSQGMAADQQSSQDFVGQDQALRGTGMDAGMSQRLTADFQQQRAGVEAVAAAQQNVGNVAGAGWAGLSAMMMGAGAMRGADAQTQAQTMGINREAKATADIAGLQAQKGSAFTKNTQSLRASEFEKAITSETLNIKGQQADTAASKVAFDAKYKTAKLKADREYRRASLDLRELTAQLAHGDRSANLQQRIKEARSRQTNAAKNLDLAQQRLDLARNKETRLATPGETKGQWLPPVAQAHAISDFHRLQGDPTLRKMKKDGKTRQEAADAILSSDKWGKLDPALVTAALDMVWVGHISNGTAAKLHRSKIKVSGLGVPGAPAGPKVKIKNRNTQGTSGKAGGDPAGRYK